MICDLFNNKQTLSFEVTDLQKNGADGIHIYTMNKPVMAGEIVAAIH